MAETTGTSADSLIDRILDQPRDFQFLQAVRILTRHLQTSLGSEARPREEKIRFRAWDSLAIPRSDIDSVRRLRRETPGRPDQTIYEITGTFLGLYGPTSPLPTYYTERIIQSEEIGDEEDRERLRAFLDIFHHRIYSFMFRIMTKYRYHLLFENNGGDKLSNYMRCLIGMGTRNMPDDDIVPIIHMVRYAGLFTQSPKSASGLRSLLADYFNPIDVEVEQCAGRWLKVEDQNRLGSAFCQLGADMIVGSQIFDRTGAFQVRMGPMNYEQYSGFLPFGDMLKKLRKLVDAYLLDNFEFNIELLLLADEVPPIRLGEDTAPTYLGWTGWLGDKPTENQAVTYQACNV